MRRKLITLLIVITIIIQQSNWCYARNNTYEYTAIVSNRLDVTSISKIKGNIYNEYNIDESSVYYLLGSDVVLVDEINKNYNFQSSVMSRSMINFNKNKIMFGADIASNEDIKINSCEVGSDKFVLLYSEEDIRVKSKNVKINGVLCAPNGKVAIKADKVEINGAIIADKVEIISKEIVINPNLQSENTLCILENYVKEGYMQMHAYMEDGKLGVYCDPNLIMEYGEVYTRIDNQESFVMSGKINGNEGWIDNFKFDKNVDVIIKGFTKYGQVIESDVVTMEKKNSEINYIKLDTDKDGIEDGIEIFYLNSDYRKYDTDIDGVNDGREEFYYGTDSNKPNNKFMDLNYEDVVNKGKMYEKGRFDKVITIIKEDGIIEKQIFDFINERQKYNEKNGVITVCFYDEDMNLANEYLMYNGETRYREFVYNGDKLVRFMNNDYELEFEYDESASLSRVSMNDEEIINYQQNGDNLLTTYANGSVINENNGDNEGNYCDNSDSSYKYEIGDTYEKIIYDTGLEINYQYDKEKNIVSISTNDGFYIKYNSEDTEDEKINIIDYSIDDFKMTQANKISYDDNGKHATSELFTGVVYNKNITNGSEEKTYCINDKNIKNIYKYDEKNQITEIEYYDGTIEKYIYDLDGNVITIKENGNIVCEFQYDALGRLILEKNYKVGSGYEYEYDIYDNIQKKNIYKLDGVGVEEKVSTVDYEYSDIFKDQLISVNGTQISYDQNGKPVEYLDKNKFEWNGERLSVMKNDDISIVYSHDYRGIVSQKKINGRLISYKIEGRDYISENDGISNITYLYDERADVIGFVFEGNDYYYIKNAFGDVRSIIDGKYNLICSYNYDSWGNVLSVEGDKHLAEINSFRYRSYYYDKDMGMYYLQSRYYDSGVGRFISSDSIEEVIYEEDNYNMYAYCGNNPNKYVDPNGTVKIYIFSINEFGSESDNIKDDFEKYYNNAEVTVYKSDDLNSYIQKWNNLPSTSVVVINTHGNYSSINSKKSCSSLNRKQIKDLEYKNILTLILLSCEAGNQDYAKTNIAATFSKRISGCVIASDGLVESAFQNVFILAKARFSSLNSFNNRNGYGWLVYKYFLNDERLKYIKLNMYSFSIEEIMDNLICNSFYRTFK